jgi:hypothetical protein
MFFLTWEEQRDHEYRCGLFAAELGALEDLPGAARKIRESDGQRFQ